MISQQSRNRWAPQTLLLVGLLFFVGGCASPFSQFGLFSDTNKLDPNAKMMLEVAPRVPAVPRELAKNVAEAYVVEPGDVLLVQPAKFDSPVRLPGDQPILPDGTISLGEYGRVGVAGQQLSVIEQRVQQIINAKEKEPGPITVRLVARQSKVYYVLGEVNAPGSFVLSGRETVLDAILMAGGLTDKARRNKILLSRPTHPKSCRIVRPVRYDEIVQLGDTSTNYQIRAGDRIFVPSSSFLDIFHDHHEEEVYPQTPCLSEGTSAPCEETPTGIPFEATPSEASPLPPPVEIIPNSPRGS